MDTIARQLEATYPENETWKLRLVSLHERVVGNLRQVLFVLFGACAPAAGRRLRERRRAAPRARRRPSERARASGGARRDAPWRVRAAAHRIARACLDGRRCRPRARVVARAVDEAARTSGSPSADGHRYRPPRRRVFGAARRRHDAALRSRSGAARQPPGPGRFAAPGRTGRRRTVPDAHAQYVRGGADRSVVHAARRGWPVRAEPLAASIRRPRIQRPRRGP